MKRTFKFLGCLALAAMTITACKKDTVGTSEKLSLNATTASVTVGVLNNAAFTTPLSDNAGSTGNWGTTYFDLDDNSTVTSSVPHQAIFNGAWDGVINPASGYTLAYKDFSTPTSITLSNIALSDLTSVTATVSSLGYNTPGPGWYTYDLASHTNAAVPNRYVVIYSGSISNPTELYVAQLTTIGYTADGSTGKFFGNVSFQYKKLK